MQFTQPFSSHMQNIHAQMAAMQQQMENNSWIQQPLQHPLSGSFVADPRGSMMSQMPFHSGSAIFMADGKPFHDYRSQFDIPSSNNFGMEEIIRGPGLKRKPSSADRQSRKRNTSIENIRREDQKRANNLLNEQMLNNIISPNIPVNPQGSNFRGSQFLPPRPSKYVQPQLNSQRNNFHQEQMRQQQELQIQQNIRQNQQRQQQLFLEKQQQQHLQQQQYQQQNHQQNQQNQQQYQQQYQQYQQQYPQQYQQHNQQPQYPSQNSDPYNVPYSSPSIMFNTPQMYQNNGFQNQNRRSNVGIGVTPPRSILTPSKHTNPSRAKSPSAKRVKFTDER